MKRHFVTMAILASTFMARFALADEGEEEAVAAMVKLGAGVERDEKRPRRPVVWLDLSGRKITDDGIRPLSQLKEMRSLFLHHAQVTDAGLKHLIPLQQLQTLTLGSTMVTDAGLNELTSLKRLQRLDLTYTKVTDSGLKHVAQLLELEGLFLGGTDVTDAGLKELTTLKKLQILDLGFAVKRGILVPDPQVTDEGIEALRKALPNCNIRHAQPRVPMQLKTTTPPKKTPEEVPPILPPGVRIALSNLLPAFISYAGPAV